MNNSKITAIRLSDCFMEIMTYNAFFLDGLKTDQPSFDEVMNHFRLLLSRSEELRNEAGFSAEDWKKALFAVCAWIDESILCSGWMGKDQWQTAQLQRLYFNTANAGEEFFINLSALDEKETAIREVYEYCLALGFKGRYFRPEDEPAIASMKLTNLCTLIEEPDMAKLTALFPQAYAQAPKSLKRKAWSRGTLFFKVLILLLPIAAFAGLFYVYRGILERMTASYFGAGF